MATVTDLHISVPAASIAENQALFPFTVVIIKVSDTAVLESSSCSWLDVGYLYPEGHNLDPQVDVNSVIMFIILMLIVFSLHANDKDTVSVQIAGTRVVPIS